MAERRHRLRAERVKQLASWVSWLATALLVVELSASRAEADEPWLVHVEASAGMPVSTPQRDWYGFGGSLALSVEKPLVPWFSLQGRLRTAGFLDGDKPSLAGVEDPGLGTLNMGFVGFAVRVPKEGSVRRATGLWLDGGFGGGFTGKELRPAFEAGIGYGLALGETMSISPMVRFLQVLQPDDELSASDARIGLVGLRVSLFDARPERTEYVGKDAPSVQLPDEDGDGIIDMNDSCLDLPEDADGFEDGDGCPEEDNDRDGLADKDDRCPNIPEDADGFQDEDGCLDDDNDQDGVLDAQDQCSAEPETLNGEQDEDGCPDEGLIVMQDDRIVLEERVLFESDRARVRSSAEPVLRAIVRLWKQHPEWMKVRIEGHADARGTPEANQQISQRRAANVRQALIKLGMSEQVVEAEGFGATKLLTTGTTDEDHRRNRRVEFVVIARFGDAGAPEAPPAAEQKASEPAAIEAAPTESAPKPAPNEPAPPASEPATEEAKP